MHPGKLGVWYFTERVAAAEAARWARRIEELGYSTLWIPETVGRHPFVHAGWLLANTERLIVATGIASIYNRDAGASMAAARSLAEQSGGRFILGLGVSHQPLVEGVRGHSYDKPLQTMRRYLEQMRAAPYQAVPPAEEPPVVLAALGPKMNELSRSHAAGALPYFVNPAHTARAREWLGDAWLCVEQKVVLETDAAKARAAARAVAAIYLGLPNYRNNWLRLGFEEADFENGGSDRFIDAMFAWGDPDAIRARLDEHYAAGADHVCIQPVDPARSFGVLDWAALEALAPPAPPTA